MKLKQHISRRQLIQLGLLTGTASITGDLLGKIGVAQAQAARAVRFERSPRDLWTSAIQNYPGQSLSRRRDQRRAIWSATYVTSTKMASNDTVPMIVRSRDGGLTWGKPTVIWPHLQGKWDMYGSVSRSPAGELYFYGAMTPMGQPGETVHQAKNEGMKANEIFWAKSPDSGRTWTEPTRIPLPIPARRRRPAPCASRGEAAGWFAIRPTTRST